MGTAVGRLQRIRAIQDPMLQMIGVLETMSPLDFLSFRDYLYPASGESQRRRHTLTLAARLGRPPSPLLTIAHACPPAHFPLSLLPPMQASSLCSGVSSRTRWVSPATCACHTATRATAAT